jgi:uncharacterized Zn-binding protein involved in type VI secretion
MEVIMPAAARITDRIGHGGVSTGQITGPGVTSVLIEGQAAAVFTTPATCNRPRGQTTDGPQQFTQSSKTVYIGGSLALRVNDSTVCTATILSGAQRVLIGD